MQENSTPSKVFKTETDFLDAQVERQNQIEAVPRHGISCDKCRNKGTIFFRNEEEILVIRCDCFWKRETSKEMHKAELGEMYQRADIEKFQVRKDFQQIMASRALKYIQSFPRSLFIGGQVGSGKTHLALSVIKKLVETDQVQKVKVMKWVKDISFLKQYQYDEPNVYTEWLKDYRESELLLIDDLLKGKPTDADLRIFMDILDSRYGRNLPTIITTEKYLDELLSLDEAFSRINERSTVIQINREKERNLRL